MKHEKKQIKNRFSYQINIYGYQYSLWKHVLILIGIGTGIVVMGMAMELNAFNIGILLFIMTVLLPFIITNLYKNLSEQC